ncbi:MAG: peptide ABC transporter substrate-binding protein, partial [Chloroflexi bacterium]|nr:peptide ABC transporter substrate-binding protein [Chloroflexota bacterium]
AHAHVFAHAHVPHHSTVTLVSVRAQAEPVTYYTAADAPLADLDPQQAADEVAVNVVENLFLGLTDFTPGGVGAAGPELATAWSVSDDGLVWTFSLRDDVPWVRYDAASGEIEVVRLVTAADAAYAFQRACDPRLGSFYSPLAAQLIAGCGVLFATDQADVTRDAYDMVGVRALDDLTLEVTLQFPAPYFLSITALPIFRPVPADIVAADSASEWGSAETLVSNGPFVITEWTREVRQIYLRNPYLPDDVRGPGNVERVIVAEVRDMGTRFALYRLNQLDDGPLPPADIERVVEDPLYAPQVVQTSDLSVNYFGFAHDKPPFDDVHARRAFSAALDRGAFVADVRQGRGVPMIHLTPPGMFGAPPINEVGVGYDPEYAREQLALAGYPDCAGFPVIDVAVFSMSGEWVEFLAADVARDLGCDEEAINLIERDITSLLVSIDATTPTGDRPHIWAGVWLPDYPDAQNFVGDLLACTAANPFLRPCDEVDDLITQAAAERDPEARIELYYRIEDLFFGPEGLQPIIPVNLNLDYRLYQPWLTGPFESDGIFGGLHWDWVTVDQAAQQAGRGE